ncbi:hypothetical protein OIU84_014675 [Salix udensis]|uniref:Pentatricopeptide repeat-containing protein n=1 Tax=Salix udensis TaxID=889485 RepID=A0AAD6JCH3_9ROSI|nr:hypothetical protein OIU84_014675 [Salix udensis]
MIKEAIDLYEFAMNGANKPSAKCCTYLLRKIVVGKQMDMVLFSRVVEVFTGNGNVLTDPMLDAVLKALTNVGKFGECNKVLREMKVAGFVASGNLQRKIAFGLTRAGMNDEANEFVDHMESSGRDLSYKAWASLIEGHCVSGDLEKASDCFKIMIEKKGVSGARYAFELLGDDAIAFMNAMTTKKFPSISVALRLFKALFKAQRHDEAQDLLSKCPIYIRNRDDVLNLFSSKKFSKDTTTTTVSV